MSLAFPGFSEWNFRRLAKGPYDANQFLEKTFSSYFMKNIDVFTPSCQYSISHAAGFRIFQSMVQSQAYRKAYGQSALFPR